MTPLRQRPLEDLQRRNYAPKTIACFVQHVAPFARHFGRSPELLGAAEVRAWQLHLLQAKHASWSAYNQSVCALRFFYGTCLGRPDMAAALPFGKRAKTLPAVLSREEVLQFFAAFPTRWPATPSAGRTLASRVRGARRRAERPQPGGVQSQTAASHGPRGDDRKAGARGKIPDNLLARGDRPERQSARRVGVRFELS